MSVENRHETSEQPESREQNLEQEHSDNREKRLSDSDLDKVDDNSDKLATDNMSDGNEKDANKETDKEVSDVSQDEPDPSLEADQQNEKDQIAEEFPEPSDTPEVNTELSNAADASDNRTDVADNERTKHEDICDVDNIDNKVETSSASEGKDGVLDEAKDFEDTQEVDPEISDPDSRKQQVEDVASIDMKDVKEEPETALESKQNKDSLSDLSGEKINKDDSKNKIDPERDTDATEFNKVESSEEKDKGTEENNPDRRESSEKKVEASNSDGIDSSSDKDINPESEGKEPDNSGNIKETSNSRTFDKNKLTEGQEKTHAALYEIGKGYYDRQTFPDKGNPQMLDTDKEKLSDSLYNKLENTPKEDRNDCRVPAKNAIGYVDEQGHVKTNWKDGSDGSVDGTQHSEVIKEGTVLDRLGSNRGSYLSPMKDNGEPYSIKERATGDRLIESNIQDNSAYHKYIVSQDLSEKNIRNAIEAKYQSGEISEGEHDRFNAFLDPTDEHSYYNDQRYFKDSQFEDGANYEDKQYGVKVSIADEMHEHGETPDGGAIQYEMPFSVRDMEKLGLISEI